MRFGGFSLESFKFGVYIVGEAMRRATRLRNLACVSVSHAGFDRCCLHSAPVPAARPPPPRPLPLVFVFAQPLLWRCMSSACLRCSLA